ncbi:MAG: SUMF1/EgtB/PvdO family nonheme iron enzyme [Candidatus Coatesbacteria bacterium]|nr:SUMF1/EgtB/PvdO family nonheme iron enzyme [Candidatus Coatesbacteria bacterium]
MRNKLCWALLALMISTVLAAAAMADPAVQVYTNKLEYYWGDDLKVYVAAQNPDSEIEVDFYLFLKTPSGKFLFWPTFSTTPQPNRYTLPAGLDLQPTVLIDMQVAEGAPLGTYTWYGALTNAGDIWIIGEYGQVSVDLISSSEPLSAYATANPKRGPAPLRVSFHGEATDGMPPYSYYWDFTSNGIIDYEGQDIEYTYGTPGMYEALLVVEDAEGSTAEDYLTINVSNELTVEIEASATSGEAPLKVSFTANATGGFEPYTYEWDFQGDNKLDDTTRTPEYTYTTAGKYNCAVRATDSRGSTAMDRLTITVDSGTAPPGMVLVPAGEFSMGSTENGTAGDETPVHDVWLDAYYIDRYPVTNSEYREFILDTGNLEPAYWDDENLNQPDHPVVGITEEEAQIYCIWVGKTLPTEAQWEKAAKGPTHRMFPWGDFQPNSGGVWYANLNDPGAGADADGFEYTSPVGYYNGLNHGTGNGGSPYGCYDMAGNVWEYCSDWYTTDYYYFSPYENPTGPSFGTIKTIRGGSYDSPVWDVRTSCRDWRIPTEWEQFVGFRCSLTLAAAEDMYGED